MTGSLSAPLLPLVALVVDDDPGVRSLLGRLLIEESCGVLTAATIDAARTVAASWRRIDLLVVDLRLDDGDGLDFAHEYLRAHPDVPFIVVTGHLTDEAETAAIDLGAQAIITKPVRLDMFLTALRPVLAHRKGEPSSSVTEPEPNVDRCARLILAAASGPTEPRTTPMFACAAAISVGAFRHLCWQLHLQPHDVRDLARVMWALDYSGGRPALVESVLDVRDHRTMVSLLDRAGIADVSPDRLISRRAYLLVQRFVLQDHPALQALLKLAGT